MEYLRKYFKDEESYNIFLHGINNQLSSISFGNRAKIKAETPLMFEGSIPLHVEGEKGSKMGSYWLKIDKMSTVTLD